MMFYMKNHKVMLHHFTRSTKPIRHTKALLCSSEYHFTSFIIIEKKLGFFMMAKEYYKNTYISHSAKKFYIAS